MVIFIHIEVKIESSPPNVAINTGKQMGNEKTDIEYHILSLRWINPMQMLMTLFTFCIRSNIFPKAISLVFNDGGLSYDNNLKKEI